MSFKVALHLFTVLKAISYWERLDHLTSMLKRDSLSGHLISSLSLSMCSFDLNDEMDLSLVTLHFIIIISSSSCSNSGSSISISSIFMKRCTCTGN